MTPTIIAVRPALFSDAATAFVKLHGDIGATLNSLYSSLQGCSQMAGNDRSGRRFAENYDKTVNDEQSLLAGIALLGNACGKMAELLDASAVNHANVNTSIGLCTPTNPTGSTQQVNTIPALSLGSSFGGPGEPSNWEKLKEFLESEIFPDGEPEKLEQAGQAWTEAAASLRRHKDAVRSAVSPIASEKSAEVGPAQDQASLIEDHLGGIAASCDATAKLCNQFATEVRRARNEIGDLVRELTCELVAAVAIGFALTLVTSGLGGVLATATGVARAKTTGSKIVGVIKGLAEAAGQVVRPMTYVLDPVGAAVGDLGVLMGARAAMFSMQMSKNAIRVAELEAALARLPDDWTKEQFRRAADPDHLRRSLEAEGVPKALIDDAVANNPYRNMTPQQILDRYWVEGPNGKGHWAYPPNQGFVDGKYEVSTSFPPGSRLDRIGDDGGAYLGSKGDSYDARALPPGKSGQYLEYEGTGKKLPDNWELRHGTVGKAFGHEGGGQQWVVVDKYTGDEIPVADLDAGGYIKPSSQ